VSVASSEYTETSEGDFDDDYDDYDVVRIVCLYFTTQKWLQGELGSGFFMVAARKLLWNSYTY